MHYKVTTGTATHYIKMVSSPTGNTTIISHYGCDSYQVTEAGMQFFDLMRKLLPKTSRITEAEFNTQFELAKAFIKE